jgi:hypothetical protein
MNHWTAPFDRPRAEGFKVTFCDLEADDAGELEVTNCDFKFANSLGAGGNGGVVEGDGVIGEGARDAAGGTRSKVSVGLGLQKIMNHWTDPLRLVYPFDWCEADDHGFAFLEQVAAVQSDEEGV